MGKQRTDQTPAPSRTDVVSASDESFAASEEGRPIPVLRGTRKIAGRFVMGPIYGQRVVDVPVPGGGKK